MSRRSTRGSALFETLFMFPFLFGAFMMFVQLSELEVADLATEHAAVESTRAASVILADDPRHYDTPVGDASGERLRLVREAATIPLRITSASPRIDVSLPEGTQLREGEQITVRVTLDFECRIPVGRLVCGWGGRSRITREARLPYQGAGYEYP